MPKIFSNNKLVAALGATILLGGGVSVADEQINPYTDKTDRVEMLTVADVPDAGEQKVELIKAKPEIRFHKWNDEINLGLTYGAVKGAGNRPLLSNKMEYKDTDQEVHDYPLADGFEIEVVLKSKPATNIVTFTLDNYESLDFFYQPALTQQEIDEGAERPENVVGSYAIYANGKANYCTNCGTPNYATGKIGHIYRPKIIDSAGTEVWGDLHIENGILSVTIPQDFLDNAVYPVRVDPTFGYASIGASSAAIESNIRGSKFSISENGTGTSITWYGYSGSSAGNQKAKIYNNDAGITGLTNGESIEIIPEVLFTHWRTATLSSSPTFVGGTSYWLVAWSSVTTGIPSLFFDTGDTNQGLVDGAGYGTWPDPLVETLSTNKHSIYATYTPSGGGGGNAPDQSSDLIIFE